MVHGMWNHETKYYFIRVLTDRKSYFMIVTPLAWIVMKSSSIMEVIIASFSKRLQLFKSADKGRR